MKKSIILLAGLSSVFVCFAQETPTENVKPVLTKQEYLQKSKGQKTGAIVMISAGGAITLAGLIVGANAVTEDIIGIVDPTTSSNNNGTIATVMVIAGVAAMLGSIGLFVSSHKNKVKALSMSFKNEPAPQFPGGNVYFKSVPSLSLKVRL